MSKKRIHPSLGERIAIVVIGNGAGEVGLRSSPFLRDEVEKTKAIDLSIVDWIALNTERNSLDDLVNTLKPNKHLLLGPKLCKGEGAGFNREIGAKAFDESKAALKKLFVNSEGVSEYRAVLIMHTTPKGTGAGVALLLGKMLRDELKIPSVLFQSIRPSSGEISTMQRQNSDKVVEEILNAGFTVSEIDNEAAYIRSSEDATMDEVYALLDTDVPRSWQAWLFVLQKPGAADVSDFNRQIIGSGVGKRIVTGYASFKVPPPDASEEAKKKADEELAAGLKQVFDFWPFYFQDRQPIRPSSFSTTIGIGLRVG